MFIVHPYNISSTSWTPSSSHNNFCIRHLTTRLLCRLPIPNTMLSRFLFLPCIAIIIILAMYCHHHHWKFGSELCSSISWPESLFKKLPSYCLGYRKIQEFAAKSVTQLWLPYATISIIDDMNDRAARTHLVRDPRPESSLHQSQPQISPTRYPCYTNIASP